MWVPFSRLTLILQCWKISWVSANWWKVPSFHHFWTSQGLLSTILWVSQFFPVLACSVGSACWNSHSLLPLQQRLSSSFSFPSWAPWNGYSLCMFVLRELMNRDWPWHARHFINTWQKYVFGPQSFSEFFPWFKRMLITNSLNVRTKTI